eukprot:scaffold1401_cov330-Pavlova_lutheri.AAC.133
MARFIPTRVPRGVESRVSRYNPIPSPIEPKYPSGRGRFVSFHPLSLPWPWEWSLLLTNIPPFEPGCIFRMGCETRGGRLSALGGVIFQSLPLPLPPRWTLEVNIHVKTRLHRHPRGGGDAEKGGDRSPKP